MITVTKDNPAWHLAYENGHLAFYHSEFPKPFWIDFDSRRYQKISRNELLVKAVGIKKNDLPSVLDLTAGFGKDAYLLYCLGCNIQLVERSPLIAALLQDALTRVQCNMPLFIGEALDFLNHCDAQHYYPDVIYFDPIFPEAGRTAKAQKSTRILQLLAEKNQKDNSDAVFAKALSIAKKRVVIKRPRYGETITAHKPAIVFCGESVRFDVYFCRAV